jgi:hypothetical protein
MATQRPILRDASLRDAPQDEASLRFCSNFKTAVARMSGAICGISSKPPDIASLIRATVTDSIVSLRRPGLEPGPKKSGGIFETQIRPRALCGSRRKAGTTRGYTSTLRPSFAINIRALAARGRSSSSRMHSCPRHDESPCLRGCSILTTDRNYEHAMLPKHGAA